MLRFFGRIVKSWPVNWRDLIADVSRFWGWGPRDGWDLTGTELMWWLDQANRIAAREKAGRR
jgi:hypothetical protein